MNHHPFANHKKDERHQILLDVFGTSTFTSLPTTYDAFLEEKYPDIPAPYRQVWAQSDEELAQSQEWRNLIDGTISALERAISVSKSMLEQDAETIPAKIRATKNTLKAAVHRAEELLAEISLSYPIVQNRSHSLTAENADHIGPTPKLLFSNDDEFIFWLPSLPSRKRTTTSLIYQEIKELLFSADLPHFPNWHCAFIHCFRPKHIVGVYDVDNYDYKPTIDLIARSMLAKDSFEHFSLGLYNVSTDELRPGCYVYVTSRESQECFIQTFVSKARGFYPG